MGLYRSASLAAALSLAAGMTTAADLRVMSSNAMREALRELVPQFEKASGHKVAMTFVGSVDMVKRLRAGEGGVDVVVLQASSVDELAAAGKVVPGSRVDFARSIIGVAVRSGASRPDISSGEALKRALLASKSIIISAGASGMYLSGLFERMGIPREKVVQTKPGTSSGEVLARGEGDIGFQQVSELLPLTGIDYLGPLPPDVQHVTVFSGGIHAAAADPQAARELMKFLASPAAAPVLRAKGLEPAL
jgi:molybdate transport system substrate-binding protein